MKIPTQKMEWEFQVDRAYMPLSYSFNSYINCRTYLQRYIDIDGTFPTGQFFYPNDVFWIKGIREEVVAKQVEHHKAEGNAYLWKMAKLCEDVGDKTIADLSIKLGSDTVADLSQKEVLELFTWATEKVKNFSVFITIPWVMEAYLTELMKDIIKPLVSPEELDKTIADLLLPVRVNASSEESPALWKIAKSAQGLSQDELVKKVDEFIRDFGWVHIRWFKGTPLTREVVLHRIEALKNENLEQKLEEFDANIQHVKDALAAFAKKHALTETQVDTINLVKEYVYIRTFRTDTLGKGMFLFFPLIKKIGEYLNLGVDDLLYHSEAEIKAKLAGEKVEVNVSLRKENWAICIIGEEYEIFSGTPEVERLKKEFGVDRGISGKTEVKGQPAFVGVTRGKVKIVLDPSDISKVEKGDILVAVMTFPSYIAAMEKASAFVTDEGGILCHASIIAREMKKPCVISTKIATKVFKDGDMVEVDAEKGIVKIVAK